MAIPRVLRNEIEGKLKRYCNGIPEHVKDKLRLEFEIRGNTVILIESRPAFRKPGVWTHLEVAQFRYKPATKKWTLHAADRNSKWHDYTYWNPNWNGSITDFDRQLEEVEKDPTSIFWG